MDFEAIRKQLGLSPAEMARKLRVSTGHVADLQSGRRKLSINLAAKLEPDVPGILETVVAERVRAA